MSGLVVNDLSGAWDLFAEHPVILLMMPVVGAFIGWITKVIAIEMVFKPIEFKGIGPIGWQGQLPRRAAKFGSQAAEIILDNVIDPRDLVDRLDPNRIAVELDTIMLDAVDDVARDILGPRWEQLPAAAKAPIIARARARSPQMIASLLHQAKDNIDELFNVSYLVTSELLKDKRLLNELVRDPMKPIMKFMKDFGLLFGFVVGLLQMVAFAFTENHLIIPLFGLFVGLFSDYMALQMLFSPKTPKRYFFLVTWYGLAFKYRDHFIGEYGKLAAEKILTPSVLMGALLDGPLADRLVALVQREVEAAIDAELGVVERLVPATIGTARYQNIRTIVVTRAQERMPEASARLEGYAAEALDVERTIQESLGSLGNRDLEEMLRPVFKDDEWLVVAIGGGLGFAVGELQIFLLTSLGGL